MEASDTHRRNAVRIPPTVAKAIEQGWSILPCHASKKPCLPSWKDLQRRRATSEEAMKWAQELRPAAWGVVTGAISEIIALDFDGTQGVETMKRLGLNPHLQTPSGGYHVYFQHPGHHVPTVNGKTKLDLARWYPGLDIRGDGGYALFHGRSDKGVYRPLRPPEAERVATLPAEVCQALGLAQRPDTESPPAPSIPGSHRVDSEKLLQMAVNRARTEGRNNAGFWLATQLRDNGYTSEGAAELGQCYVSRLSPTNTKGHLEPYTLSDFKASVEQAFRRTPREPWRQQGSESQDRPVTVRGAQAGPLRFQLRDNALYCSNPGENQKEMWICSSVEVVGETRDARNESWGRLVEVKDRDGIVHKIALPMTLFAGDGTELRQALLSVGLEISPAKRSRELLSHYIQMTHPSQRFRCVTKIGWHGSSFVLPDVAHSTDTSEPLLFQAPTAVEHFLETKGTLEEWRSQVSSLCPGNSRLVLAVSCAFAGPLLTPLGMECGGFHFLGGSSQGKSTALQLAGSVLGGGGRLGFVRQWRSTTNALEPTAEVHNDLTLFLDEIHEAEPAEVVSAVYMLANGMGKARSSKSIQAQRTRSWRCLFFSSGEISLAEHARTGGRQTHGGAEVRLLGIPADAGKEMGLFENIHSAGEPRAFADLVRAGAMRYYGTAIRAFLSLLCRDLSTIVQRARQFTASLLQQHVPVGASGEVRRAAERFFLVAFAGELASEFGITNWPKTEAISAAVRCFNDWLSLRGTEGAADIHAGMRQVRTFFQAHGNSRFQRLNAIADSGGRQAEERIINQVGYKEVTEDGCTIYYILPDIFRAEVCRGFNHTDLLRQLEAKGHLVHDNGRLSTRRLVPGVGRPRFYAVLSSILE